MIKGRGALRNGLPLLPLTPSLIVIVGVAVAIAITLVGLGDLRLASDANSSLRAQAIAATLAARLRVTGSEDRKEVVQAAARGTYADILLIDHKGGIVADASLRPPTQAELVRCLLGGKGVVDVPLLGRTQYAVQPLGPPLEQLSVIAMVPAPVTPIEARGLAKAVATLTALLVGAAGMVGYVFASDVRSDVTFVRHRIAAMAETDADPAGAPIPVRALDQVGVLTSAFNSLVDRFAAAERSYRQDLTFASTLDKERSAFLAALSHELRTPLNAILGFADVLFSEVEGTLDDATREELGVIRASASHLRSLIDDILELSALESGGLRLNRQAVDVYAIAEEVVREQHPMAIKFTSRGGVRIVVDDQGGGEVAVHTIDSGPGIAPEERAAIFEEYAQAGDTAARRKGTGLGLAIARRLVAMHGGELELSSRVGHGSRFTFKLKAFAEEVD